MNINYRKELQTKIAKGLLDMIILQYLDQQDMHGYQLISKIRKDYGVSFGPSTIYPLLGYIEKKGQIESTWNMDSERPRKVYKLTGEGKSVLAVAENSLKMVCKNLNHENNISVQRPSLIVLEH